MRIFTGKSNETVDQQLKGQGIDPKSLSSVVTASGKKIPQSEFASRSSNEPFFPSTQDLIQA